MNSRTLLICFVLCLALWSHVESLPFTMYRIGIGRRRGRGLQERSVNREDSSVVQGDAPSTTTADEGDTDQSKM